MDETNQRTIVFAFCRAKLHAFITVHVRHEKCQFYAFGDVATGADRAEYFMVPNPLSPPPENRFHSNQISFYSNLGEVFPLPEFQAKLFLMRN